MLVIATNVGTGLGQWTGLDDGAVAADVIMIAYATKATGKVGCAQGLDLERVIFARGRTVYDQIVDFTHKSKDLMINRNTRKPGKISIRRPDRQMHPKGYVTDGERRAAHTPAA